MKKGFTLVELMGVIVILSILLLMSVPAINNTIKKQEDKEYKSFENTLCSGTKAYMRHKASEYKSFFTDHHETKICIMEVYDSGYLSDNLTNPYTDSIDLAGQITMTYKNDKIECSYQSQVNACRNFTPISNTNINSHINSNSNSNAIITDPTISNVTG